MSYEQLLADAIDAFIRQEGYRPDTIAQIILRNAAASLHHMRQAVPGLNGRIGVAFEQSGRIVLDVHDWKLFHEWANQQAIHPAEGDVIIWAGVTVILDESVLVVHEKPTTQREIEHGR